jgi:hypothetical protein
MLGHEMKYMQALLVSRDEWQEAPQDQPRLPHTRYGTPTLPFPIS